MIVQGGAVQVGILDHVRQSIGGIGMIKQRVHFLDSLCTLWIYIVKDIKEHTVLVEPCYGLGFRHLNRQLIHSWVSAMHHQAREAKHFYELAFFVTSATRVSRWEDKGGFHTATWRPTGTTTR